MDEATFTDEVRRCEPKLYRIAYAMLRNDADCADALQEAILRAWQRCGQLREVGRFDSWLTRIVINECRDIMRRANRHPVLFGEMEAGGYEIPPPDPALRDVLMALPEKYRLPLVLHHLDGYAVNEIAGILAIPRTTVKWRLHEARERLRRGLAEEGVEL